MLENIMGTITPIIENFDPVMLLRLPLVARAVIAIVLALIGTGGIYFALAFFPKSILNQDYFDDFVHPQSRPLKKPCWIIGFFLLPGLPPSEGGAYTLPMYLLAVEDAMELWLAIVVRIAIFVLIFAFLSGIYFQRTAGRIAGIIPWFCCMQYLGFGILSLCGIEVIARVLVWLESLLNPINGSLISILLRFLFLALMLLQVFLIFGSALGAILDFVMSFFTKDQIKAMELEIKAARQAERKHPRGGDDSSGGDGFGAFEAISCFPKTIYINGELYHLQNVYGDRADYCCAGTGYITTIHKDDIPK